MMGGEWNLERESLERCNKERCGKQGRGENRERKNLGFRLMIICVGDAMSRGFAISILLGEQYHERQQKPDNKTDFGAYRDGIHQAMY